MQVTKTPEVQSCWLALGVKHPVSCLGSSQDDAHVQSYPVEMQVINNNKKKTKENRLTESCTRNTVCQKRDSSARSGVSLTRSAHSCVPLTRSGQISLTSSVAVEHHVYLLTKASHPCLMENNGRNFGEIFMPG